MCFACTLIGFSVDHWFWWCILLLSGGKICCDEEIREDEAREKPRKFSISNRLICNLRVRRERVYKRVRDEIDICRQRALSHQHHCTFHTESHSKVTKIFLEIVGERELVRHLHKVYARAAVALWNKFSFFEFNCSTFSIPIHSTLCSSPLSRWFSCKFSMQMHRKIISFVVFCCQNFGAMLRWWESWISIKKEKKVWIRAPTDNAPFELLLLWCCTIAKSNSRRVNGLMHELFLEPVFLHATVSVV